MTNKEKPIVVVDVDMTIYDCFAEPPELIPGSRDRLESLAKTMEVRLWSAAGEDHAREVAEEYSLTHVVTDYHAKPPYPPTEEAAIKILGRAAALQVDDDPTERIEGESWHFVHARAMRDQYGPY